MAVLGIILIVVGAILSFAVRDSIAEVDLTMVGYICMAAGALAVIIGLIQIARRGRTEHITRVDRTDHVDRVDHVEPVERPRRDPQDPRNAM